MFSGFTQETLSFFRDITENNNKPWFDEHKTVYQKHVRQPMIDLLNDLSLSLLPLDPQIDSMPPNSAVSRINRDVRFSKDKSPYRNKMWLTVKRHNSNWKEYPCFYVEISEHTYTYGMGFYSATTETMKGLREFIAGSPDSFRKMVSLAGEKDGFIPGSERYKRILSKTIPEDLICWYQMKNIHVYKERLIGSSFFTPELTDEICGEFEKVKDLYLLLSRLAYSEF
ncbi:MAG: DUF2461 domain-containing protein [Deferribacterales bacterium]